MSLPFFLGRGNVAGWFDRRFTLAHTAGRQVGQFRGNLVAGNGSRSDTSASCGARYDTNGSLDSTFGKGGIVSTTVGKGTTYLVGLALQSDGNIVAVGSAREGWQLARQVYREVTAEP